MQDIKKVITFTESQVDKYQKEATKIMDDAIPVEFSTEDPFKAQRNVLRASKVQELAGEYMKLLAQLRSVEQAHKAAQKIGYTE